MKRKVKRYDEGGGVEGMKKGLFGAKEDKEEDSRGTYFKSPRSTPRSALPSAKEKTGTYGPSSSAEPASFKEAFAAARKAGDSSFTFDGKKFTTETAGPKKPKESVLRNAADEMAKGAASESRLSDSIRDDEARVKSNYMKNRDLPTVERQRHFEEMASGKYANKNRGTTISGNTAVYGMKKGGSVSSASSRADGCAMRGKTRGKMV
jgi:hypothetical protein